ncbi:hypothetical protein SteCoe_17653 [Stentor coeruleus]|uniref:Uncharacterized protein n=1 Tax=Stentor coeruleus TaxID=5963 RepID=A0A1R2BYF6_9CILI|nr:hypothetical protein SteCoe_17653 [Stentor coeruleus]
MDETYKILILGERNVGKTSILLRFCTDAYYENTMQSSGISYLTKEISIDGEKLILLIWDTASTEAYRAINKAYYRNSLGILVVYDHTEEYTFDAIPDWINEAQDVIGYDKPIFIICNKCDLTEKVEVPESQAISFASSNNYNFYTTSAKTGYNITTVFYDLGRIMLENRRLEMSKHRTSIVLKPNLKYNKVLKCKC